MGETIHLRILHYSATPSKGGWPSPPTRRLKDRMPSRRFQNPAIRDSEPEAQAPVIGQPISSEATPWPMYNPAG